MDKSNSPFGFAKPEDSLGFLLWQTTVTWQRLIKNALEPQDISHAQFVLLALLLWFEEQQIKPNQVLLIGKSKLDKMTVSKSLKKLALQKLITRAEDEADTRAKKVALTNQGKILTQKLVVLVEKIDQAFFSKLPQPEQNTLITLLSKLMVSETK